MIVKIEVVESLKTMGNSTEEDLFIWCAQLRSVLLNQYPGTEINVQAVADMSSNEIYIGVEDESDAAIVKDTVQNIRNRCWEDWSKQPNEN